MAAGDQKTQQMHYRPCLKYKKLKTDSLTSYWIPLNTPGVQTLFWHCPPLWQKADHPVICYALTTQISSFKRQHTTGDGCHDLKSLYLG